MLSFVNLFTLISLCWDLLFTIWVGVYGLDCFGCFSCRVVCVVICGCLLCLRMRCVLWFGVCGLLIASVLVGYVCCGVCCGYDCMFELVW